MLRRCVGRVGGMLKRKVWESSWNCEEDMWVEVMEI